MDSWSTLATVSLSLSALLIAGLADRVRGGYPEGRPKWVKYTAMALIGPSLTLQVTSEWTLLLASTVLAFLTMWRQDNGWRGRWVAGELAYLKAMQWGLVASLSFLPLIYFEPMLMVYAIAFPIGSVLAQVIAIRLPAMNVLDLRHAWPWSELIELPIIGVIAYTLGRLI